MKTFLQLYLSFFLSLSVPAQTILTGTVNGTDGEVLIGANVYLKDTYDGATTDVNGKFRFESFEEGEQMLIVSFVGFETKHVLVNLLEKIELNIQLKEAFNAMEAVTISAGSFEASDEKKAVVLKSLDVAMTAGATADIPGALNTLPGTQKNGESGRLFVRGGTSNETKVFIDGVEAANFYNTSGPSIPSRSRFSPFLFKGVFFSTGGYSAEYGQALSSALVLNSSDIDPVPSIELSVLSIGADAAITRSWNNQSFYAKIGHIDFTPYTGLISQRVKWIDPVQSSDANFSYKKNFDNGARLRSLVMMNTGGFALEQKTKLNASGYHAVDVRNDFFFANVSYQRPVGDDDVFFLGGSATYNYDHVSLNSFDSKSPTRNGHLKTKYLHAFSERTSLNTGIEFYIKDFEETLTDSVSSLNVNFTQIRTAAYAELDHYLSEKWVLRGGVRGEVENYLHTSRLDPRISVAHRLNEKNQLSFAAGSFHQDPEDRFVRFSDRIDQERATHYILNYQRITDKQVFRVEGYWKDYSKLIRYTDAFDPTSYSNDGNGYAYGLDVFWRDRGGVKNLDYWISYSWLKSERYYNDYPVKSTPGFTSAHNVSLVAKRWFPGLKSQMGATYSITSGRPFENPNKDGFNESRTSVYQDLSFNMAWLPAKSIILYVSASNLLGQDQVFGYQFSDRPDETGFFDSEPNKLPAKRFLFVGCFITIGTYNRQLQNL